MKTSDSESISALASRRARNEKLVAELREIVGHTPSLTTDKTNAPLPEAETPFEIDGQEHAARLVSLSLEGGRLATDHKPPVGSLIRIGRITARVVGHLHDGITIDFVDIEA